MKTNNKLALITGGTRGIGAAIAVQLQQEGYLIAANYAGNHENAKIFSQNTNIPVFSWDVAHYEACLAGIEKIEAHYNQKIDIVINNAGVINDSMFHKMTWEQWQNVINVNLHSAFNVTRCVINHMREQNWGRIVNISSVNAQKGQLGQTNYAASKAALIGFTKALALENAKKQITVNCLCPGYIHTDMIDSMDPNVVKSIVNTIPVGRMGTVKEVAKATSYLVSEDAAFMTGAVMTINGGQHIANG